MFMYMRVYFTIKKQQLLLRLISFCFSYFKLKHYETSQKSKENENNTENEVVSIERSTKRKGRKKEAPLPPQPEVIDLSGSESK